MKYQLGWLRRGIDVPKLCRANRHSHRIAGGPDFRPPTLLRPEKNTTAADGFSA